jgi:hypothetical protein
MARCIARMVQREGMMFLYYFGDMSPDKKTTALKRFHEDDNVKLLVR